MSELSQTEIWEISAAMLHTPTYRRDYAKAIAEIIQDRNASILDTACGTGFPTLDLYEMGFKNITCSDGDEESAKKLGALFKEKGLNIPVFTSTWQDLGKNIDKKFDFVINVDNSLVYLDGWFDNTTYDPEEASKRITEVLKNFYDLLKPGGTAIIGSCETFPEDVNERTYLEKESEYKGQKIGTAWHSKYDWEHRVREWTPIIKYGGKEIRKTLKSYIVKKDEVENLVKKAGFEDVQVVDIRGEEIYDYLFVGHKKN